MATRTKRPTKQGDAEAARELVLYIDNTSDLSLQGPSGQGNSVARNAFRRFRKGTYNPELAVKLFGYLVETGAKRYTKEFGSDAPIFDPATRLLAAKELEQDFRRQAENGEFDHLDRKPGAREVASSRTVKSNGIAGVTTYSMPSHWASYLINGDASGIDEEDVTEADAAIEEIGLGAPVDVSDGDFRSLGDFGRLGGDYSDYTFHVPSEDTPLPRGGAFRFRSLDDLKNNRDLEERRRGRRGVREDDNEPARDTREIILYDEDALRLMEGWWNGQSDPLYAIHSMGGAHEAWVFEDAIDNLDYEIGRVKPLGKGKFQLGKGTFTKKEIDELHTIRDGLAAALESETGRVLEERASGGPGVARSSRKQNGYNHISPGISVWVSGDEPTRVTLSKRLSKSAVEKDVENWWGSPLQFRWIGSGVADIDVVRGMVRDYEVIDRRDRRIAGPYKSQSDARAKAGPGDVVRYVPKGKRR